MKVVLRDPPLPVLLIAIVLDLTVNRSAEPGERGKRGWISRQLGRFLEWRNSIARRA